MSIGGAIALLITWLGTLVGGLVAIFSLRHSVAKEHANRRIALENYADEVGRYHRRIRAYLIDLAEKGVIDITRVDLSQFPPPPAPKYDGE